MQVNEVAKDATMEHSELFDRPSKFRLTKVKVREYIYNEVDKMQVSQDAVEVVSSELQQYLECFYTPMTKPKATVYMHFQENYVYAILGNIYAIVMENKLPAPTFTGFSIPPHVVGYLKALVPTVEKFKLQKIENISATTNQKTLVLLFSIGNTILKVNTLDATDTVSISNYVDMPTNLITVDKLYLLDVLKRVEGMDQAFIKVDIEDGKATMLLNSVRTSQEIPVLSASGSGSFSFMLKPEQLGYIVLSHITKTQEGKPINDVVLGLQVGTDNKTVQLTCKDQTDTWSTKYPRAPIQEMPKIEW